MKLLFKCLLLIILVTSSLATFAQNKIIQGENGKFGITNYSNNDLMIPSQYDKIYPVLKSFYTNGFICEKQNIWSYFNHRGVLVKDSIDMNEWIGNSKYDLPFIQKNKNIYLFDTTTGNRIDLSSDSVHYKNNFIIENHNKLSGLVSPEGNVLISFKWEKNWNHTFNLRFKLNEELPLHFTNEKENKGAFYQHDGTLILSYNRTLGYLGIKDQPYLRIYKKGKTIRENRSALGYLDVKNKKIKNITSAKFWYMNPTSKVINGKKAIALASLPDKTEVYIFEDGSTIPKKKK